MRSTSRPFPLSRQRRGEQARTPNNVGHFFPMPILAREPDQYPADLLDQAELGEEPQRGWWVVHVRPRQEKALARQLTADGVWHYLPQYESQYKSPGGRKRKSYLPLFPGYVFVYGDDDARLNALKSRQAVQILAVEDHRQLTFDLRQICRLTHSNQPLTPKEQLPPGTEVRITSGPFEGFVGRILRRRTGDQLLVVVNYLQRGVTVELGDCGIEKL